MEVGGIIIFVLIAFGVLAAQGTVLFGGWLLLKVVGLIGRGLGSLVGLPPAHRPALAGPPTLRCPRSKCHAANVPAAKFCRRCGVAMTGDVLATRGRPAGRRAAMW